MRLIKCPRCELNYISEDEGYCKICKREMKGESYREETELCTVCNERPVMPGKDVCYFCYKEIQPDESSTDESESAVSVDVGIDPVSSMDEMIPEEENDIPEGEYKEIESDLSLDELSDEENLEDDEDEDGEE